MTYSKIFKTSVRSCDKFSLSSTDVQTVSVMIKSLSIFADSKAIACHMNRALDIK